MPKETFNTLVVLGPTASGKTRLGVQLAAHLDGEILSADSRQVYRGLDIGSGKDLDEYQADGRAIPYHLIDLVDLKTEFSVFHFQRAFFEVFEALRARKTMPVVVGGTGLYLDAVLRGYHFLEVPENPALRAELDALPGEALLTRLLRLKPSSHNTTDLADRARTFRAIEIAEYEQHHTPEPTPEVRPLILGTLWPRDELRARIALRLKERLEHGLIEEVETLHADGYPWERFDLLGLEYRFVSQFLRGEIRSKNDLRQKLGAAINQFAKRQDTWFRRMERLGQTIHWVPRADIAAALHILQGVS